MHFSRAIRIGTSPEAVFAFLRDIDTYPQEANSPVLRLDKTTEGPVDVGTGYLEVVRMLGPIRGTIRSTVTLFEPPAHLHERFRGAGMVGHLAYEIERQDGGTDKTESTLPEIRHSLVGPPPCLKRGDG